MLVLFGSETGNARFAAERVARSCLQLGLRAHALPMDAVTVEEMAQEPLLIFVCSTTGQGEVPAGMRLGWRRLLRKSLPRDALRGLCYAVFGLGDSGYVQFNFVAKKLDRRLEQLGARRLAEKGLGDDQAHGGYDTALDPWLSQLLGHLQDLARTVPLPGLAPGSFWSGSPAPDAPAYSEEARFIVRVSAAQPDTPNTCSAHPCPGEASAAAGAPANARVLMADDGVQQPVATAAQPDPSADVPAAATDTHAAACRASAQFHELCAAADGLSGAAAASASRPDGGSNGVQSGTCLGGSPGSGLHAPLWAPVAATQRLTSDDCERVVKHLEFELPQREDGEDWYQPGDILSVFPHVDESKALRFLQRINLDPAASVTIACNPSRLPVRARQELVPGTHSAASTTSSTTNGGVADPSTAHASTAEPTSQPLGSNSEPSITVSALALVTGVLDVTGAPPKRRMFEVLARFATSEQELSRLQYFGSAEGRDDMATYCTRERRSLLEVLEDFPSARPPLDWLLEASPVLQPRQFSISSSPLAHPGLVTITVALVDYRTPFRRRVQGLASSWLSDLRPRRLVPVWFQSGVLSLPAPDRPLICVGPGTGVAPFRAFLQHRAALQRAGEAVAPSMLFFGCRHQLQDLLYQQEWEELQAAGVLHPETGFQCAFSRQESKKVYVQDRIREHAVVVWDLLYNKAAHIFVSGSANQMPAGVSQAFKAVIAQGLDCSHEQAEKLRSQLEAAKRYVVEAWS